MVVVTEISRNFIALTNPCQFYILLENPCCDRRANGRNSVTWEILCWCIVEPISTTTTFRDLDIKQYPNPLTQNLKKSLNWWRQHGIYTQNLPEISVWWRVRCMSGELIVTCLWLTYNLRCLFIKAFVWLWFLCPVHSVHEVYITRIAWLFHVCSLLSSFSLWFGSASNSVFFYQFICWLQTHVNALRPSRDRKRCEM